MNISIADFFVGCIRIETVNASTSIAHLAQFIEFDTEKARQDDKPLTRVAYEALLREYVQFEMLDGRQEPNDDVWMKFKDGSKINIRK